MPFCDGMANWYRITQTSIQIWCAIDIDHRWHQRQAAGSTTHLHKPLLVCSLWQILRFSCQTIRHCHLTYSRRLKVGVIVKWIYLIGIDIKYHIHIKQAFSAQHIFVIMKIILFILWNHTISCAPRLPWYIIHGIACARWHTHHIGERKLLLHQII